jgi:hypothetical protein
MYSDMQNPRVQAYGNIAILTYNFAGIRAGADGKSKLATPNRPEFRERRRKWMLTRHFALRPERRNNLDTVRVMLPASAHDAVRQLTHTSCEKRIEVWKFTTGKRHIRILHKVATCRYRRS